MLFHSIEMLDPENIIDTMNRPIVVNSSDMNLYFCKYNRLSTRAYRLYKEYLIASFLPIWDFKSSPVNLIKVNSDHIPSDLGISKNCFESPCFGLQMVNSSNELDRHNLALLNRKRLSHCFKDDFLKLSFFDIWIANEDRSHNNYNILLAIKDGFYELYPIDHEACFNHRELTSGLTPIAYEESLIYSEAFSTLFKKVILPDPILQR